MTKHRKRLGRIFAERHGRLIFFWPLGTWRGDSSFVEEMQFDVTSQAPITEDAIMKARKTRNRSDLAFRLTLERLPQRLMPGDALLGILIGGSFGSRSERNGDPALIDNGVPELRLDNLAGPVAGTRSVSPRKAVSETAAVKSVDSNLHDATAPAAGIPSAARTGSQSSNTSAPVSMGRMLASQDSMITSPGVRSLAPPHPALARAAMVNHAPAFDDPTRRAPAGAGKKSPALEKYGNLPLAFEANHGQLDSRVDFMTRTDAATVFLTPTAAVFSLNGPNGGGHGAAVHMQIVGANPNATPLAGEQQPGIVNYFIGNDPSKWHTNVATFGDVQYQDVYPGIDLAYYSNNGRLEYDFVVSPGADPAAITLNFAGAERVDVDPRGNLVLHTNAGEMVQQKPFTYQETGQIRKEVASRYVVDGTQVRFELGEYDATRPLVIDPLVLGYSTFLGGSGAADIGYAIAVDSTGSTYVTGETFAATTFPDTPGAFDNTYDGSRDAFVAKLNATGTGLVFATYLGGSGGSTGDFGYGIAVDDDGNAYIAGHTDTANFPTTLGAFDTTLSGTDDAFVTKLNASGSALVYSTYLGGSGIDLSRAIAVDADGSAYLTGMTASANFPVTVGALDTTVNGVIDAFVAKLAADGSALDYATYLGGSTGGASETGFGIAVDTSGNAYVTGQTDSGNFPTTPTSYDLGYNGGLSDAFAIKLNATGSVLLYGTYLGGALADSAFAIAVDAGGSAYLTGRTTNHATSDFPTTVGAYDPTHNGSDDAFVTKLLADGSDLAYSTYLGGTSTDAGQGIAVDDDGNAYVAGHTSSSGFPTTGDGNDLTHNGSTDALFTKLNASGSALVYSTFLGGSLGDLGYAVAADSTGNAYVTGESTSTDFPTTPGALKRRNRGTPDAFVTKFAEV
jgi:hypothetical protein